VLRRFERLRSDTSIVRAGTDLQGMQACFWKVCSAMSNAGPVGCARRRLAILSCAQASWSQGLGCRCLARYVRDYVIEHLADDDAVLSSTRLAFSSRARRRVAWHGQYPFGRQDYELPDRRLRYLRFASWPCFIDRALYLPKNGPMIAIVWKPHTCRRHGLCDQTKARDENDRPAIARGCAIQWSAADSGLRFGDIEQQLRRQAKAMCSGQ